PALRKRSRHKAATPKPPPPPRPPAAPRQRAPWRPTSPSSPSPPRRDSRTLPLVKPLEQALEIRPAHSQVLHLFPAQPVHQLRHRAVKAPFPHIPFAPRQPQKSRNR